MIYLDNIPIQKPLLEVIDFAKKKVSQLYGDTTQLHSFSQKSISEIELARKDISTIINIKPKNLFFTSGFTEANNIIANSLKKNNLKTIITSVFENKSILEPLKIYSEIHKIPIIFVKTNTDFGIDLKKFEKILSENKNSFVSLSHVNEYTGRLLPLNRIAKITKKNNSIFHCDISNSIGKFNINLSKNNIDLATAGATNIGGIRGAGILYCNDNFKLKPVFYGNKNEYSIRPGIENTVAIATMSFALKKAISEQKQNWNNALKLKDELKSELELKNINFLSNSFSQEHFPPFIVNINIDITVSFKNFLINLDLNDIAVANNRKDFLENKEYIRISFSPTNTVTEIKKLVQTIFELKTKNLC